MAGKNKIERSFRFLLDNAAAAEQDLSGDLVPGSFQGGGLTLDQVDMTGVSETVRNYLQGHAESEVSAQFHANNTATTGAYTVLTVILAAILAGTYTAGTLTAKWGSNGAAPTTGDFKWSGEYALMTCTMAMNGGKAVMNTVFKPNGSTAPAFSTI